MLLLLGGLGGCTPSDSRGGDAGLEPDAAVNDAGPRSTDFSLDALATNSPNVAVSRSIELAEGESQAVPVVLDAPPAESFSLRAKVSDPDRIWVDRPSLRFEPADFDVPRTVIISSREDAVYRSDETHSVTWERFGGDLDGTPAAEMTVSILESLALPSIAVAPTSLSTSESGGTATFEVALSSEPTHAVTVRLSGVDATEGSVDHETLTFEPSSWTDPRVVTVTGLDDGFLDGPQNYQIALQSSSNDGWYDALQLPMVEVDNLDDDSAGVSVNPTALLTRETTPGPVTFSVVLDAKPTADVSIGIASNDTSEGTVAPSSVVFTPDTWDVPRVVAVTSQDDDDCGDDGRYTIELTPAVSLDPNFDGIDPDDVWVDNLDDDHGYLFAAPTTLVTTEQGDSQTFSVAILCRPTTDVTIEIENTDPSEGLLSTSQLVFTPATWDSRRSVTVHPVDDAIQDGGIRYVIELRSAASSDPAFVAAFEQVVVWNEDDD